MKMLFVVLFSLYSFANSASDFARVLTFGPMIHLNFGGDKMQISWALELAYWQSFDESRGYHFHGVDLGIEFQGRTKRIYSEYQNGYSLFGGSAGPVLEYSYGDWKYGLQGGAWGAFVAGVDVRVRYMLANEFVLAPGWFVKWPLPLKE